MSIEMLLVWLLGPVVLFVLYLYLWKAFSKKEVVTIRIDEVTGIMVIDGEANIKHVRFGPTQPEPLCEHNCWLSDDGRNYRCTRCGASRYVATPRNKGYIEIHKDGWCKLNWYEPIKPGAETEIEYILYNGRKYTP